MKQRKRFAFEQAEYGNISKWCKRLHYRAATNHFLSSLLWATLALLTAVLLADDVKPLKVVPKGPETEKRYPEKDPVSMPFYIFNNSVLPPVKNFCPSGYMPDGQGISMMGAYRDTLKEGFPGLKITFKADTYAGWGGVFWQNPPNNWGNLDGGYNLTKAKKVTFWARGDKGGETVEFKIGGITGSYPDSDLISSGKISLTPAWKQYSIDLTRANLRYISGGFCFSVERNYNPNGCIFYLDDILYED